MLKGIHQAVGPDLLKALAEMGHGDEIVLADAHFPAHATNERVIRADGLGIETLLDGILALLPLDTYATPVVMMSAVEGDVLDPSVQRDVGAVIARHEAHVRDIERIERFAFYERARSAFAVVASGETRLYANVILKKGVVRP